MTEHIRVWIGVLVVFLAGLFLGLAIVWVTSPSLARHDPDAAISVVGNSFVLRGDLPEHYAFSCTMLPKSDAEAPSGASWRTEEPSPSHSGLPIPYTGGMYVRDEATGNWRDVPRTGKTQCFDVALNPIVCAEE